MPTSIKLYPVKGTYKLEVVEGELAKAYQRDLLDFFCGKVDTLGGSEANGRLVEFTSSHDDVRLTFQVVDVVMESGRGRTPTYHLELIRPTQVMEEILLSNPPDWLDDFLADVIDIIRGVNSPAVEQAAFSEVVEEIADVARSEPRQFTLLLLVAYLSLRAQSSGNAFHDRRRQALSELLVLLLEERIAEFPEASNRIPVRHSIGIGQALWDFFFARS